ncbi:ATP-binding protein [Streptomyces sp. NPDC005931]|uniref:sensor histidine kinase n=1 Tax=Streptomyces sp. NPDC005931 TaxID=3364737 RepID=UPI003690A91D
MSDLRAPAARADRREGGRHGRPPARTAPALPETHIRPQLLRLAVLPPVAVALSACAAVLFIVRSTGVRPGPTLWGVLGGAVSVTLAGIVIAAVAANRAARSVYDRLGALRRSTARREADLRALVEALRRGDAPPQRGQHGEPPADADDFDLLAAELARAHDGAVTAVVRAAQLSSQAGSEQKLEVFVNLARRLQSLVHREISILDELENEIEDPDLLKGLFHVDHLATRIRRHAENLAVLGGAVSRRQWSNPVPVNEVLRSAIAEVEQYSRVKLVPPIDGTLRGHAVADVIHLLAELVENATVFSAPHTQVLLRAGLVTSGLAVEVEDRGLGMPAGEQDRMNRLLTDPDQVNVASLLADGRIGLYVVSQLAKRHGIHVRLQTNIYGGVQAVLVVPQALLGGAEQGAAEGTVAGAAAGSVRAHEGPLTAVSTGSPGPPREGNAGEGAGDGAGAAAGVVYGDDLPSVPRAPLAPVPAPGVRRGHRREAAPDSGAAPARAAAVKGGAPAPLPVRGARETRTGPAPTGSGSGPGTDDRRPSAEAGTAPLAPRGGPVRGTMDRPQLPRRRAQEHIAPQLRDGPAPRQEPEHVAGHDPHLVAAFQRGVSLAEAQQHMELGHVDLGHLESGHMDVDHMGPGPMADDHTAADHTAGDHRERRHPEPTPSSPNHTASDCTASDYTASKHTVPDHTPLGHADTGTGNAHYMDAHRTDGHHGASRAQESMSAAPPSAAPVSRAPMLPVHRASASALDALSRTAPAPAPAAGDAEVHPARDGVPVPRTEHTTRRDGSTPAG